MGSSCRPLTVITLFFLLWFCQSSNNSTCPRTNRSPVYQQTSCCENWQAWKKVDTWLWLRFTAQLFAYVTHGNDSQFLINTFPSINGFVQVVPNVGLNWVEHLECVARACAIAIRSSGITCTHQSSWLFEGPAQWQLSTFAQFCQGTIILFLEELGLTRRFLKQNKHNRIWWS